MPNFEMVREDPNEKRNAKIRAKLRLLFICVILAIGTVVLFLRSHYIEIEEREKEAQIVKQSVETKAAICTKLIAKNYLSGTLLNCQRDKFSLKNGFDKFIADVEVDLRKEINIKLKILNNQTFLDLAKAETITFREAYERGHTSVVNSRNKAIHSDYNQLFEIQNVQFSSGGFFYGINMRSTTDKIFERLHPTPGLPNMNESIPLEISLKFRNNRDDDWGNVINEQLYGRFLAGLTKIIGSREKDFSFYRNTEISVSELCELGCFGDVYYSVHKGFMTKLILQHITVKPIPLLTVRRRIKQIISYDKLADEDTLRRAVISDTLLNVLDFK